MKHDLELRHLRCLVAIVDAGTFTDAAIELGISQAAVSRNLIALERVGDHRTYPAPGRARLVSNGPAHP